MCYVKSLGRLEIVPYSDFLSLKNNRYVKIRLRDKLNNEYKEDKGKSVAFFEQMKRLVKLNLKIN